MSPIIAASTGRGGSSSQRSVVDATASRAAEREDDDDDDVEVSTAPGPVHTVRGEQEERPADPGRITAVIAMAPPMKNTQSGAVTVESPDSAGPSGAMNVTTGDGGDEIVPSAGPPVPPADDDRGGDEPAEQAGVARPVVLDEMRQRPGAEEDDGEDAGGGLGSTATGRRAGPSRHPAVTTSRTMTATPGGGRR